MEILYVILFIGIIAFVATNIDDLFISIMFFSDPNYNTKHIVAGKYLGISLLIIISSLSYFVALIIPVEWIGLLGILPILIGFKNLANQRLKKENLKDVSTDNLINEEETTFLSQNKFRTISVATITFANGGDNIGVYVPLFASSELAEITFFIIIFLIMTGIWCVIPYYLVNNEKAGDIIKRYIRKILPFFLIGLGIFILIKCNTFSLIF